MNLVSSLIVIAILSVSASSGLYGYRAGISNGIDQGFDMGYQAGLHDGNPFVKILEMLRNQGAGK